MDVSQINWAYWAGGVSAVLMIAWIVAIIRSRPGLIAIVVGFAHLFAAALNSAAPIRGALDPDYVGYGFGLISADKGLTVTTMAGAVFLTALVGAFSALRKSREAMLITAITSLLFLVVLGWPWLQGVLDGVHVVFQLGEYLTIPGYLATGLMFLLMVAPFLLGLVWALARARKAPSA